MTDMIITVVGSGVAALAGVVSGSRLSRRMDADNTARMEKLDKRVDELENTRMEKLEQDVSGVRSGCRGSQHDAEIVRLNSSVGRMDAEAREVGRKMERLTTALEHQTVTFRDMTVKMERYMESTARQDERISNTAARVDGLHSQFRKHTDDRGIHNHG